MTIPARTIAKVTLTVDRGQLTYIPYLIDLTGNGTADEAQIKNGQFVARVPRGAYTIALEVLTPSANGPPSATLLAVPRFTATAPVTVALDAREGNRATAKVDAAGARTYAVGTALLQRVGTSVWGTGVEVTDFGAEPEAYAVGTPAVARPFQFSFFHDLLASAKTYELVLGELGRLPADPTYPVADRDLADMSIVFGAHGIKATGAFIHQAAFGRQTWCSGSARCSRSRCHRPAATWSHRHRSADRLALAVQLIRCGAIRPSTETLKGGIVLKRNGTEIATFQDPFLFYTEGATGTATYTAIMHASRQVPWSNYVPKVSGTWTFKATQPSSGIVKLPIISTRVGGDFDRWGRAPAGQAFPLTLDVTGTDGGVASAVARVSYDDGRTWTTVPVSNATGEWVATVTHPDVANAYVSLRVIVTDRQGNSAGWTATRSYRIAQLG